MADQTNNQALNGLNPLAYLGVNPKTPPNFSIRPFPPTQYDSKNVQVGALWLNTGNANPPTTAPSINDLYVLVALYGGLATWLPFSSGVLESLTGNTGGAVHPTANNINVVGDGTTITIAGNPGTSTLTVSLVGGGVAAQSFPTDSGTATPNASGVLNINASNASTLCGSTIKFIGSTNFVQLRVSDASSNTILGSVAGNLTISGSDNSGYGVGSLHALTSGSDNSAYGENSLFRLTSGSNNVVAGSGSAVNLTTGSNNIILGMASAASLVSGAGNVLIGGDTVAAAYTTNETNNIVIGANVGVVGDNNTIRIGSDGVTRTNQTKCFIKGIAGVSVSNQLDVVIDSVTGQLGTIAGGLGTVTTLHSQDGNNVTPTAGVINISGSNGLTTTGTVGPNTLTVTLSAIPGFGAYKSATSNNVTGDGTFYTVIFDTELFDTTSNYNNATGVFTAPTTGVYQFTAYVQLQEITDQVFAAINIITTGFAFHNDLKSPVNCKNGDNILHVQHSVIVPMTATDTAFVEVSIGGGAGAKTVDVTGTAAPANPIITYFSGSLVH